MKYILIVLIFFASIGTARSEKIRTSLHIDRNVQNGDGVRRIVNESLELVMNVFHQEYQMTSSDDRKNPPEFVIEVINSEKVARTLDQVEAPERFKNIPDDSYTYQTGGRKPVVTVRLLWDRIVAPVETRLDLVIGTSAAIAREIFGELRPVSPDVDPHHQRIDWVNEPNRKFDIEGLFLSRAFEDGRNKKLGWYTDDIPSLEAALERAEIRRLDQLEKGAGSNLPLTLHSNFLACGRLLNPPNNFNGE